MKGFLKRYAGALFIALTIAVVVFIAMREGNWADTVAALPVLSVTDTEEEPLYTLTPINE